PVYPLRPKLNEREIVPQAKVPKKVDKLIALPQVEEEVSKDTMIERDEAQRATINQGSPGDEERRGNV
ncbi:unnamed protein product, partial [Amoebophrya sp. A25]